MIKNQQQQLSLLKLFLVQSNRSDNFLINDQKDDTQRKLIKTGFRVCQILKEALQQDETNKRQRQTSSSLITSKLQEEKNVLTILCEQYFSQISSQLSNASQQLSSIPSLSKPHCFLLLTHSLSTLINLTLFLPNPQCPVLQQHLVQLSDFLLLVSKVVPSLPPQLVKLAIKNILNLQSINQYQLYNINANEEYKFEQETQIHFLYIICLIKLSSHLKIFSWGTKTKNQLQAIQNLLTEGKILLNRLNAHFDQFKYKFQSQSLSLNPSKKQSILKISQSNKFSSLQQSHSQLSQNLLFLTSYIQWVQTNWLSIIRQKINNPQQKKFKHFQQLPIEYFSVYQLFCTIHKFSEIQSIHIGNKTQNQLSNSSLSRLSTQLIRKVHNVKKTIEEYLNPKNKSTSLQQSQKKLQLILQSIINSLDNQIKLFNQTNDKRCIQKIQSLLLNPSLLFVVKYLQTLTKSSNLSSNIKVNSQTKIQTDKKIDQQITEKEYLGTSFKTSQQNKFNESKLIKQNITKPKTQISSQKQIPKIQTVEKVEPQKKPSDETSKKSQKKIILAPMKSSQKPTPFKSTQSVKSNDQFSQKNQQMLSVCRTGQYLTKFNYDNNDYKLRYVKLSISSQKILWAKKKQGINDDPSQYSLNKVVDLVYGDVTEKIKYHCRKSKSGSNPIQPWRCFSLVCKDRTLDFYCSQSEYDIYFWLIGLGSYLKEKQLFQTNYTRGNILWKRCFMKFRYLYLPEEPKIKQKQWDKYKKLSFDFALLRLNVKGIVTFGRRMGWIEDKQKVKKMRQK